MNGMRSFPTIEKRRPLNRSDTFLMKHLLLACLFPTLLSAETMSIIDELGKTVLYGDIAISPDAKNVAWVQSTAATTAKQIYVRSSAPGGDTKPINIEGSG